MGSNIATNSANVAIEISIVCDSRNTGPSLEQA